MPRKLSKVQQKRIAHQKQPPRDYVIMPTHNEPARCGICVDCRDGFLRYVPLCEKCTERFAGGIARALFMLNRGEFKHAQTQPRAEYRNRQTNTTFVDVLPF